MERYTYWRFLAERWGEADGGMSRKPLLGLKIRRTEEESKSIIWAGRELSLEAYLEVPTFLRRGLRSRG
jgi:hypothetical protein